MKQEITLKLQTAVREIDAGQAHEKSRTTTTTTTTYVDQAHQPSAKMSSCARLH